MAKEARPTISLKCQICGRINYYTEKNIHKMKEPLQLKKYCKWCRKRTVHKETK